MALPEQQPEIPPDQQVTEIPQNPEIPPAVEQAGVQQAQPTMQPIQAGSSQQIAQPVPQPAQSGQSVTVPAASQQQLAQMAKGNVKNSQTWFGVFWLRKIKKAVEDGITVLFGGKSQ